jgi:DNA invertase Pin-like site-specific DNA recombinase
MNPPIQEPASLYSPANAKPLKVALYARVSLEKDDKEDPRFQDPENQLASLRRYAAETGCVGFIVYREYSDRISGARRSRPQLDQLLRDARGHRFSLVLATKVDRLARSVTDLYSLLEELKSTQVGVRFIDQPEASTDTPQGELVLGILGHVAQFERSLISSRTKAGIARYRAQEGRWGRKRQEVDSAEIVRLREQELSLPEIARRLETSEWIVRSRLREEKGRVSDVKEDPRKTGDME